VIIREDVLVRLDEVELDCGDEEVGTFVHPGLRAAHEEQSVLTDGVNEGGLEGGTIAVDPGGCEFLGGRIDGPDGRFDEGSAGSDLSGDASWLGLANVGESEAV